MPSWNRGHIVGQVWSIRARLQVAGAERDPTGLECWEEGWRETSVEASQIWTIRFFLVREARLRDRALFDLAIDSRLRGSDLVKIKIGILWSVTRFGRVRWWCSRRRAGRSV